MAVAVGADGGLRVGGARVPVPGTASVPVPPGWDVAAVASITINGLAVGAARNVVLVATVDATKQGVTVVTTALIDRIARGLTV